MQFKFPQNGYTLIEIIVVLVIITIIAGALFASFSTGREERALQISAYRLIQDLRSIQDKALAPLAPEKKNELCGEQQPLEEELQKVIFGVYFEANSEEYILFVDCDDNRTYTSTDKTLTPIGLERGVKILDLSTDGVLSIVFTPPDPKVFINGNPASDSVEITISLKDKPTKTKTIKVHESGLVEILD